MAAAVVVVGSGPRAGTRFEVEDEVFVGREGVEVVLDDPELSRRHAAIRVVPDGVEVEDLRSLNGTWVNGSRIEGAFRLRPGDVVRVGTTTLVIEIPHASPPTVLSAPAAVPEPAAPAVVAAVQPFGALAEGAPPRRIETRALGATALSFAVVVATAAALVLYFALR